MNPINFLRDFLKKDEGQDLIEYGILVVLFALVSLAALTTVGTSVRAYWNGISLAVAAAPVP